MKYVSIDAQVQQLLKENDMQRFDPYQFSPEMIRQMVDMFYQMPEPVSPAEVEQHAQLAEVLTHTTQPSKQQLDRMIKVTGAAAVAVLACIGVGAFIL